MIETILAKSDLYLDRQQLSERFQISDDVPQLIAPNLQWHESD